MTATRLGLLGAGYIARRHVEALSTFEDVAIVSIADPELERARELAAACGAQAHQSLEDLVSATDLDAIYICVPPFAHGEPEHRVLDLGLPLFVEKPISLKVETAREIDAKIDEVGVVSAVGYHWRYLEIVKRAHTLLEHHPPGMVLGHWLTSTPGASWWTQRASSGGQMLEQATHLIDLARCLGGEISGVQGWGSSSGREAFEDSDIFDTSIALLTFTSGALGVIAATCLLQASHRIGLQIIAEGLSLEILARGPGGTSPFELVIDRGSGPQVEQDESDAFIAEDRAFIDAVQGRENRVLVSYKEALKTHELALRAADVAASAGGLGR